MKKINEKIKERRGDIVFLIGEFIGAGAMYLLTKKRISE